MLDCHILRGILDLEAMATAADRGAIVWERGYPWLASALVGVASLFVAPGALQTMHGNS